MRLCHADPVDVVLLHHVLLHLNAGCLQFGTSFQEMDAMTGRQQTTKGVWMSKSPKIDEMCTLIMDLEGSDGRERGEDDTNFERQSALFALAVADVLLINVWCHDIGREHGSGKPLMKTIFQVERPSMACALVLGSPAAALHSQQCRIGCIAGPTSSLSVCHGRLMQSTGSLTAACHGPYSMVPQFRLLRCMNRST